VRELLLPVHFHDHGYGSWRLNRSCTHQALQERDPWRLKRRWIGKTTMNRPKSRTKTDDHVHGSLKESDWRNRSCTHLGQQERDPSLPKRRWIGRTTTNRPKKLTKNGDHDDHDHGYGSWRLNKSCTHQGQQEPNPSLPKQHWTGRTTTNHPTSRTKTDDHDHADHAPSHENMPETCAPSTP
jgi:hypothetical protein